MSRDWNRMEGGEEGEDIIKLLLVVGKYLVLYEPSLKSYEYSTVLSDFTSTVIRVSLTLQYCKYYW